MLSTVDTGNQSVVHANVAALTGGGYVAVWESWNSADPTDSSYSIQGRMVGADGIASGSQFQARRFMSDGTPVGNDFQVNTFAGLSFRNQTDVATNEDGRVLVVWSDNEDGDGTEIRGRLYNSALTPLGPDFRINTYVTDDQTVPQVAGYGKAGFFVVWRSFGSSGPDAAPFRGSEGIRRRP